MTTRSNYVYEEKKKLCMLQHFPEVYLISAFLAKSFPQCGRYDGTILSTYGNIKSVAIEAMDIFLTCIQLEKL